MQKESETEIKGLTDKDIVELIVVDSTVLENPNSREYKGLIASLMKERNMTQKQAEAEVPILIDKIRRYSALYKFQERLEVFRTVGIPTEYVYLTDTLSDSAFNGCLHSEEMQPILVNGSTSPQTFIYANILQDLEEDKNIEYPALDNFDKEVYNSILSFWLKGNFAISFQQIARFITQRNSIRSTSDIVKNIILSVKKMIAYKVTVNLNNEAEAHHIPIPAMFEEGMIYSTLLTAMVSEFVLNGEKVGGILLKGTPILYSYVEWKANGKGAQLGRFATSLLDSKIQKTKQNLTLQEYILERVMLMKERPKLSKVIKIDTILSRTNPMSERKVLDDKGEYIDNKVRERKYRASIVGKTRLLLDELIAKKELVSYEILKNDRGGFEKILLEF